MRFSSADFKWAATHLVRFRKLSGYLVQEEELKEYCRAFLRIVHRKHVNNLSGEPEAHISGNPMDGEWLIDQALGIFDHCPSPIELRQIYQEHFTPRDRQNCFPLLHTRNQAALVLDLELGSIHEAE